MRLRPWGRSGALVNTVDGHVTYLQRHGRAWERQALLKARPIAGDEAVGEEFLNRVDPLIFTATADEARANAREMKATIEERLERTGRSWGEVKSGEGSIRDVEFVAQFLQIAHGRENRHVKSIGTLDALVRLAEISLLQADEYRQLASGYVFLRTIEHSLQLMHHEQTHAMPDDPRELTYLARRLDFPDADLFLRHYERHTRAIRAIYEKYIGTEDTPVPETTPQSLEPAARGNPSSPRVAPRHVVRMEASYAEVFDEATIERHERLLERLSEDRVAVVEAREPSDASGRWTATFVGYDHTGDLAVVAGLLFVHGFNITSGHAFSDEQVPSPRNLPGRSGTPDDRIFVDVFEVDPPEPVAGVWERIEDELVELASLHRAGQHEEAQGRLAKRVAGTFRDVPGDSATAGPMTIEVDNESAARTVLHIRGEDTKGFLYALANALALLRIDVRRLVIRTSPDDPTSRVLRPGGPGPTVFDTLHVTDANGARITDPDRLGELRAAIVLIKQFTHLLPHSPNPESALRQFRDFLVHLFKQPNWTADFASLERSEVLDALARLLGVSTFLWEDFLRLQHDNLFPVVRDPAGLAVRRSADEWATELRSELATAADHAERVAIINAFKDREMFRVDMRHILARGTEFEGSTEFGAFSRELTELAEVVVGETFRLCEARLIERHGGPRLDDGSPCRIAAVALGKCGGRELGYASDIELMFVHDGEGRTGGPEGDSPDDGDTPSSISNGEFVRQLVDDFLRTIRSRHEGIFRIDLRLRPYGRSGSLAVSSDAFRRYFHPDGPAWPYERQALVKLRPIAGNADLGREVVAVRDEIVYTGAPFDVTAMRALREKQVNQLVEAGTFNAKLSPGGLVDIEYFVQAMQIGSCRCRSWTPAPRPPDPCRRWRPSDARSTPARAARADATVEPSGSTWWPGRPRRWPSPNPIRRSRARSARPVGPTRTTPAADRRFRRRRRGPSPADGSAGPSTRWPRTRPSCPPPGWRGRTCGHRRRARRAPWSGRGRRRRRRPPGTTRRGSCRRASSARPPSRPSPGPSDPRPQPRSATRACRPAAPARPTIAAGSSPVGTHRRRGPFRNRPKLMQVSDTCINFHGQGASVSPWVKPLGWWTPRAMFSCMP